MRSIAMILISIAMIFLTKNRADAVDIVCGSRICKNNARCIQLAGITEMCLCTSKYWGFDCSLPRCIPHCANNGRCVANPFGQNFCSCPARYLPPRCTALKVSTECGDRVCMNGGECITLLESNMCRCPKDYFGFDCSLPRCDPDCKNGGTCIAKEPGYHVCACTSGFSGEDCSVASPLAGSCLHIAAESSSSLLISSPNKLLRLKRYFPNYSCAKEIKGHRGSTATLTFEEVNLETTLSGNCTADRIEIVVGRRTLDTICGKQKKVRNYEIDQHTFKLKWITDGSVESSGFQARVTFSGTAGPGKCQYSKSPGQICNDTSFLGLPLCYDLPPVPVCKCCNGYIESECLNRKYAVRRVLTECPEIFDIFGFKISIGTRPCYKLISYKANLACECCNGFSGFCGHCTMKQSSNITIPGTERCGQSNGQARRPVNAFMQSNGRIIGGDKASAGEWPWQVGLLYNGRLACGGSLISNDVILTAAHCIAGQDLTTASFLIGATDRSANEGIIRRAKSITMHSQYNDNRVDRGFDIAFVKLSSPVNFDDLIKPVCLPSSDFDTPTTLNCVATGWGRTVDSSFASTVNVLREVKLPLLTNSRCDQAYPRFSIKNSMVCAGDSSSIDTCQGDSGGPLVCQNDEGRWTLVGITSFGINCADGYPGVYTRVSSFVSWIGEQIEAA